MERVVVSDKLRVRIPEHLALRILDQLETAGGEIAGGLLLGTRNEDAIRVERILPCRNQASAADRACTFDLSPEVIASVARAIEGRPYAVVGRYCGPGREAFHPRPWGPEVQPDWNVWVVGCLGEGMVLERRLTAWCLATAVGEPTEVAVDLVRVDPLRRQQCPE